MKSATIERPTCASCPYFQDFGEPNGRGWCATFDQMARLDYERTGACDQEIEALKNEELQQPPKPEPQPVSNAWDSVSVGLQTTKEAITELEQGRTHGQQDAADRLHPMYAAPSNQYATGYLEGYNSYINPSPQPEVIEPPTWSIQYDSNWDWYRVWVGDSCIGHGSDYQQAERIAQRYIAAERFWQQHRQAVLAGYAC